MRLNHVKGDRVFICVLCFVFGFLISKLGNGPSCNLKPDYRKVYWPVDPKRFLPDAPDVNHTYRAVRKLPGRDEFCALGSTLFKPMSVHGKLILSIPKKVPRVDRLINPEVLFMGGIAGRGLPDCHRHPKVHYKLEEW